MKRFLVVAGALLLAAPAQTAFAHGDYEDYFAHQLDHAEHERFHQEFNAAHEEAHEQGFQSPEEHEAFHQAYGDTHEQFHDDHPGTYHDHYGSYGYQPQYRSYYRYAQPYGGYGYYQQAPASAFSLWFGR